MECGDSSPLSRVTDWCGIFQRGPGRLPGLGGQPARGAPTAPGDRRAHSVPQRGHGPRRSPRPSPRLPAQPLPPLPTRLPQVSTNGNGSHSAGDQRKQNTEAVAGGPRRGKAPEPGLPRGPALPASPRPHSPAPESAPWPSPALQSRLGTAAPRAPRTAPLRVSCAAPATRSVRPRGPSRGIDAKEPQPLSRLPGTPGPGTTTPSRVRGTNAHGNGGSRGTNASSFLVFLRARFSPHCIHLPTPKDQDADSERSLN